jgi:hypothetical protein
MDNDERRPRESGADANDHTHSTPSLREVYENQRWDAYWRREYPSEFKDAWRLARAAAVADNAVRSYLRYRKDVA